MGCLWSVEAGAAAVPLVVGSVEDLPSFLGEGWDWPQVAGVRALKLRVDKDGRGTNTRLISHALSL